MAETTILVIEDEQDILDLVEFNLKQAGHRVLTAADGLDGLRLARRERPDLIVLDLMLPGLDGKEVCRRIRQGETTRNIPIIMLTALNSEVDRIVGFELGADDYLTKPFSHRELELRIQAVLRRGRPPEDGGPLRFPGLLVDPDRHRVEVDGEETMLKGMVEGVLVFDGDGRTVLANRALAEMLDLVVDPIGLTPAEIVRNAEFQEAVAAVLKGQGRRSLEIRTLGRRPRTLEVQIARLAREDVRAGAVAVFHDITERKRLEEIRRDFVANVSHELRTPLTAIRGSAETLLGGALENKADAVRFTQMIERHAVRLQNVVEDLLELARIESGEAAFRAAPVELIELFDDVLAAVADLADERGVELDREPPAEPIVFNGDRRLLAEALINLADNAIKYTEPGGRVVLSASKDGDRVRLSVTDTGIGLPAEHLAWSASSSVSTGSIRIAPASSAAPAWVWPSSSTSSSSTAARSRSKARSAGDRPSA